ncbi:hypothetical protein TRAPUB_2662 [Trametes pubescens]|uniref:Uncharacterized protein n=1 Tax=Trametes pubescens TaxID=154538 RepID=A0A1M2VG45_TRAPU|nr:hypothetical protein TRAPUB_2662 [Trametes pubescens]
MAHLALLNQDILFEVFRQVGRQRWSNEERGNERDHNDAETQVLARCARVCRAFREPSLRISWEYLPPVLPLLQLLAPHFRKLEHGRNTLHTFACYTKRRTLDYPATPTMVMKTASP